VLDPNPGKTSIIKYGYNQEVVAKNEIIKFVQDFSEGKILPLVKKETTPLDRAPGYIIPLNSDSFE